MLIICISIAKGSWSARENANEILYLMDGSKIVNGILYDKFGNVVKEKEEDQKESNDDEEN